MKHILNLLHESKYDPPYPPLARGDVLFLRVIAGQRGQYSGPIDFLGSDEPSDLVANLLDDLDVGSGITGTDSQGVRRLDTTQLAVMSIPFEIR